MPLMLYTLSGSPFGWKVQLALEHLNVAYTTTLLSPDKRDLHTPQFLALNPHAKLPVIVDRTTSLYESDAIIEYLEDAYSHSRASLWPGAVSARALARRMAAEASSYVYPAVRQLVTRWVGRPESPMDRETLAAVKHTIADQLQLFAPAVSGGYIANDRPGAADYAIYPLVALLKRLDRRQPGESLTTLIPVELHAWSHRIEALEYFARTYPPHWKE
jgi:glutathione S-transferase